MASPITNLQAKFQEVNQKGQVENVIRLDFERRIFTDNPTDYYHLYKYVIPVNDFDTDGYLDARGNILKYMSGRLGMGAGVHLGGFNPGVAPQIIDVTDNIQRGAAFILDQDVTNGFVYLYELLYQYETIQYALVDIGSLDVVEFLRAEDIAAEKRRCLNYRNWRFRGPHPTPKYRNSYLEIDQDLKTWTNDIDRLTGQLDDVILYDDLVFKIYAMEDTIKFLLENDEPRGYGVPKYGRKGGYGF